MVYKNLTTNPYIYIYIGVPVKNKCKRPTLYGIWQVYKRSELHIHIQHNLIHTPNTHMNNQEHLWKHKRARRRPRLSRPHHPQRFSAHALRPSLRWISANVSSFVVPYMDRIAKYSSLRRFNSKSLVDVRTMRRRFLLLPGISSDVASSPRIGLNRSWL